MLADAPARYPGHHHGGIQRTVVVPAFKLRHVVVKVLRPEMVVHAVLSAFQLRPEYSSPLVLACSSTYLPTKCLTLS